MAEKRNKAWWKHGLKVLISLVTLGYVFYTIDFAQVWGFLVGAAWWGLLIAFGFFFLSQWLSGLRLRGLLGVEDIHISIGSNFRLYLLGMYYNLLLPGGVGGDGYKVMVLRQETEVPTKRLILLLVADRVFGLVALLILAGTLLAQGEQDSFWLLLAGAAVVFPLLGSWIAAQRFFPAFRPVYLRTLVLSLGVQAAQVVSVVFIALALGQTDQLPQYALLFLVSSLASVLPVSIGGMGIRELTFLYGANYLGLLQEQAVAISFAFFLLTLLLSLVGIRFSFGSVRWTEPVTSEPSTPDRL